MEKKKIAIIDDHRLFRDGLKSMINATKDLEVVGEAGDGISGIRMVRLARPDLLLLDLSMPKLGGLSVLLDLKREIPDIKILVLTIHKSDNYVIEVLEAGADGYCVKQARWPELLFAIEEVLAGKNYICPHIAGNVMEGYIEHQRMTRPAIIWDTVTQREREVLKLLAEGYKSKEIAEILCIAVKTVNTHRNSLMKKLNLHNNADLTTYAVEKGLVILEAEPIQEYCVEETFN